MLHIAAVPAKLIIRPKTTRTGTDTELTENFEKLQLDNAEEDNTSVASPTDSPSPISPVDKMAPVADMLVISSTIPGVVMKYKAYISLGFLRTIGVTT